MITKINNILLWGLYILQFSLAAIFKGDIPVNIDKDDVLIIGIIAMIVIMLVLASKDLRVYVAIIFLVLWIIDTIYLLKILNPPLTLNVLGVSTAILHIVVYMIRKIRINFKIK